MNEINLANIYERAAHRGREGEREREEGNHNRERGGRDRMLQVANCQREFVATVSRNAKALH